MAKRIRAERVGLALNRIRDWRLRVKVQGATHLLPMLAVIERGAGDPPGTPAIMRERPHEYEFWDRYFRLDDENTDKPYFNPVTSRRAEADFPHSNAATIRKNTFARNWQAASWEQGEGGESWTFADDYAEIFRNKVLRKGDLTTRVPVVELAIVMFRDQVFDDLADVTTLVDDFRHTFRQRDEDFERVFVIEDEDEEGLFEDSNATQDYYAAIQAALVDDVRVGAATREVVEPPSRLDLEDPTLMEVQRLLSLGTSGIILTGVPGCGKSYYADRIARHLVADAETDIFRVQFHPSYGYEDFVEGYRPDDKTRSGFKIVDKTFVVACERAIAASAQDGLVVLLVDEINRGDPARVFGELLTYIELSYRGQPFTLPFSGREFSVPSNLLMIGTMNPHDRSVAQVDAAFVRRFDQVEIPPSREVAEQFLEKAGGLTLSQIEEIGNWFETVQRMVPFGVGHSYFVDVRSIEDLKLVWRHRMKPASEQAIELDDAAADGLAPSFEALIRRLEGHDRDPQV